MGNDSSRQQENQQRRSGGVPQSEVNRLLEEEKRRYEEKLREVQRRAQAMAAASAAKNSSVTKVCQAREVPENNPTNDSKNLASSKTERDKIIDKILGAQIQEMVSYASGSPSTEPTRSNLSSGMGNSSSTIKGPSKISSATVPGRQSNLSLERARSPYSYNKDELLQTRIQGSQPSPQNLYPNLPTYPRNVPDDFVFIKKSNPGRYQPSAPPMEPSNSQRQTNNPFTSSPSFSQQNYKPPNNFKYSNNSPHAQNSQNARNSPNSTPSSSSSNCTSSKTSFARENQQFKNQGFGSRPAPKNEDDELNCTTCGKKFGLKIFQCQNGHSSCKECKERGANCARCGFKARSPITDMRNITLEAYVAQTKVSCPNEADGCGLFFKMADLEGHLKECLFNEMACPLEKCSWKGKFSQILEHFDVNHPVNRQGMVDTEMNLLNIIDEATIMYVVDLGPFIFFVYFKIDPTQRQIFMAVQLVSTGKSASKWHYEIQIYNKREPRRKFTSTDVCQSNMTPLSEILKESKCVTIPQSYAMTFINEGRLTYKFYVKKEAETNTNQRGRWRGRGKARGGNSNA